MQYCAESDECYVMDVVNYQEVRLWVYKKQTVLTCVLFFEVVCCCILSRTLDLCCACVCWKLIPISGSFLVISLLGHPFVNPTTMVVLPTSFVLLNIYPILILLHLQRTKYQFQLNSLNNGSNLISNIFFIVCNLIESF